MARKVAQYRYYDEINKENQPKKSDFPADAQVQLLNGYVSGSFFEKNMPIVQIGIQSLPGTKFFLNSSQEPIIVGTTGVYEPDLSGQAVINALRFDLQSMINIRNNPNAMLIIDIVYDTEEEI